MRKLGSIQKVLEVKKHPNADVLDIVRVLGWQCVAKRGEYQVGDLCVYVEIDTMVPENNEHFQFLREKGTKRIKTIRLRGEISQGIVFPLSILPSDCKVEEGKDVSEILSLEKYEPSLPEAKDIGGLFHPFIPKTDETRIQADPSLTTLFAGKPAVATVKLDGTSCTVAHDGDNGFCVYSRNFRLKEGENSYWRVAKKYNVPNILPTRYALQGEICGPSWQKNRLELKEIDYFVFSVFDLDDLRFLNHDAAVSLVGSLGMKFVPVAYEWEALPTLSVDEWIELSRGTYNNTSNLREGIVVRPLFEESVSKESLLSAGLSRPSFKVINPEFLLKNGE